MAKKYQNSIDPEAQKARLDGVLKSLEDGIKNLWSSDQYTNYLKTLSKFHKYSINNAFLIRMQMPNFTRVASFTTWNKLGRHVLKGSKGIQILQPSPYKIEVEEVSIDSNGAKQTETVSKQRMSFKLATVFDISQTDGRELPTIAERLTGNGQKYDLMFDAISNISPYSVVFENTGRSGGYFKFGTFDTDGNVLTKPMIAINETLNREHQVKTLIHEITHSDLHADEKGAIVPNLNNELREVQAESVAYVVCEHFGIDSSQYSFGYIGGWASGRELSELKSSLNIIREKASDLIERIENELELMLEKDRIIKVEILDSNSSQFPIGSSFTLGEFYDLYSAERRLFELLKDGVLLGHSVSDGDKVEIRLENAYDCHFKSWDISLDTLEAIINNPEIIQIPKNKYDVVNDKMIFSNLSHEEFSVVDRLCKENNSMLFIDDVHVNQDMHDERANIKIKISTPMGHELTTELFSGTDAFYTIRQMFDDFHNIDIMDLDWTLKETHTDFAYFEVTGSNCSILRDGIYSNKMFEITSKDEVSHSNYTNAKGIVNVHYRNPNGVYSPTNIVAIDLSKDINKQLLEKLPDFDSLKTSFYKNQIKYYFGQSINHELLDKCSPATIDALGKTTLDVSNSKSAAFSLDSVKAALKDKVSFFSKMLATSPLSEASLYETNINTFSDAFDSLEHMAISLTPDIEMSI